MLIKQAKISGFGRWNQQSFDFVSGLQIILGLNEAGKTTLHQFITGVLFGYPQARGNKAKTFETEQQGAYGGSLIIQVDGHDYEITRLGRTDSKLTVIEMTTEIEFPEPEDKLKTLLSPLTRELFSAIFSFDQEELLQIFSLRPDEFNDYLRNVATPGADEWTQVAERLEKSATNEMGTTKTAKRPINLGLAQLDSANQDYQRQVSEAPNLARLEQSLTEAKEQVAKLNEQAKAIQAANLHDSQLEALIPVYQRRQALEQQLKQQPAVMPKDLVTRAEQLVMAIDNQPTSTVNEGVDKAKLEQANADIDQLERAINGEQTQFDRINDFKQQQHILAAKYSVNEIPAPLTEQQLTQIKQTQAQQATLQNRAKLLLGIGIAVALIGLLISFVGDQKAIGIILLMIGVGVAIYFGRQKSGNQAIQVPGYASDQVDEIVSMQPDARQNEMYINNIRNEEKKLTDLRAQKQNLTSRLDWLGENLEMSARKQKIANLWAIQAQKQAKEVENLQLQTQLQTAFSALNVHDEQEFKERKEQDLTTQTLQQEQKIVDEQLKDVDIQQLEAASSQGPRQTQQSDLAEQLNQAQKVLAELQYQWDKTANDTTLLTSQQKLADETTRVKNELQDYFVKKLASHWIQATLDHAIGERLPTLMNAAGEFLTRLTAGRYTELKYTKTLIRVKNEDGEIINLIDLSKGTAEQIYVALRLAFIQQMGVTNKFPVLIDDALVDFDPARRKVMLEIMQEFADDGYQLLYFTAHPVQTGTTLDLNQL
ncbi:MAG: AAA family ATPase [Lactobacillaceae bacterium]|jgi:uncharacterized protein YhaN|nr:AAA family ATPase [Lactobacillaceae bacterium]